MEISRALLIKFSRDECTQEEREAIKEWLGDGSWKNLSEGEELPGDIRERIWKKLNNQIHEKPSKLIKVKNWRRNILKVAAVLLILIGTGVFIYNNKQNAHNKQQITYMTGANEHRKVMLPDSSVVFLSPNSSIKLMPDFAKDERAVSLKGEAVFEVKTNAEKPFTVVTEDISTTALGTSFKVTSFNGSAKINVVLTYGKVVVKTNVEKGKTKQVFLKPGEEIVYNKETKAMHKMHATPAQFDYEKNVLYFKNAGLKEVVEKLERYYHVKVQFSSLGNVHWSVSGEFDYQPLEVVMKAIAYSCNIKYEIKENKLVLTPNP